MRQTTLDRLGRREGGAGTRRMDGWMCASARATTAGSRMVSRRRREQQSRRARSHRPWRAKLERAKYEGRSSGAAAEEGDTTGSTGLE